MRTMGRVVAAVMALGLWGGCSHRIPPPQASASEGEYKIGPEDVVEVAVWRDNDLSRVVPVRPDGMISLPLIGELKATDHTAPELAAENPAEADPVRRGPTPRLGHRPRGELAPVLRPG